MTALHVVAPVALGTLLELLDRDPTERMSVCENTGGQFRSHLTTVKDAGAVAAQLGAGDSWFGPQVLHQRVADGRGFAKDVIGLRSLNADLDVKAGGMPTYAAAMQVIAALSEMLGSEPAAIVSSGHGLQPHWAIERSDRTDWTDETDQGWLDAKALWQRWGRLVRIVARSYGGDRDGTFDLSRVMRTPGTMNCKDPAKPVPVGMKVTGGAPVSLEQIADACDAYGAWALPEDREVLGDVVVAAGDWSYGRQTCGYVAAMTRGWQQDTPKARHPWLVSQSVRLAAAHRLGCITQQDHAAATEVLASRFRELLKTGEVRAEGAVEIEESLDWGVLKVETFTEDRTRSELAGRDQLHTHADEVDLPDFWSARPVLQHIQRYAQARRCSPWAVLGVVLARVVTATPPDVVLPPLVGAEASLNLFVALVAPSGGGKGAAEAAAQEAVTINDVYKATVGSGEGIGHLYAHREKGAVVRDRAAVLFTVPEVDNLTALGNRQGATLMPQLRSAWSGERLGFSYADPKKALHIEAHTYRMGLVLGVQPGRAAPLLDDVDGGTPQRFVWLPTLDKLAPDEAPDEPPTAHWQRLGRRTANSRGLTVMPVCQAAREQVDAARLARLRGQSDALDGHGLLCRLKVAAALGLLEQRAEVTDEDWGLAGQIMDVSDATRTAVADHLISRAVQDNDRRGESEARRAVRVDDALVDAKVKRVCRSVLRVLVKTGDWTKHRDVMAGISAVNREAVAESLDRLISSGQVELDEADSRPVYRLTAGGAK